MNEETGKRIGIVASVIGAVGAIAYLLRKPPANGANGATGPAGAPGFGIPGIPGAAGAAGLAGAAGTVGAAGAAGVAGLAGAAGVAGAAGDPGTPSQADLSAFFVNQFAPPPAGLYSSDIASNLPPSLDLSKYMALLPASPGGSKGGCGCGGGKSTGGGCGGGKCPNAGGPLAYLDGMGSCASTTIGRLQSSMDQCVPDNLPNSLLNMIGNTQYYGIDAPPDLSVFQASVSQAIGSGGELQFFPEFVPASRFGAS
jgi:hypothetical protein